MSLPPGLLLTFYGDDFTGSSAVMEVLGAAGLRTMLFLEPPTPEKLRRYPDLRAAGVAGMSRTMAPEELERELPPVFERLAALGAPLFHYKICSTFDSSPTVGSIGRAIELGQQVFRSPFVPLIVAAPAIRRYCLFGNLFATVAGETHRLDRHPVMKVHPVTPMDEADLRLHLAKQTKLRCALMDILALAGTRDEVEARFRQVRESELVLFDVLDDDRLARAGRLVWDSRGERPLFTVGSQGVEYALVGAWRAMGLLPAAATPKPVAPVDRLLVVSGSCSSVTQAQIGRALESGFAAVDVDAARLCDPAERQRAEDAAVTRAAGLLAEGRDVIVHSARGPHDPRIAAARAQGGDAGRLVGEALGRIARAVLTRHPLERLVLSGGDTSGYGSRALGVEALEMVAPVTPGSPLCRAHAPGQPADGVQLVLKGGQMGGDDLFVNVKSGKLS